MVPAMRALLAVFPLLLAPALLAGCASDDPDGGSDGGVTPGGALTTTSSHGGSDDMMVSMVDNRFVDGNKTVPSGTAIMYMNDGARGHTVTIHKAGEPVESLRLNRTLQPGQDITFSFDEPGTYHVWCRFHGTMTAGMASVVTVT